MPPTMQKKPPAGDPQLIMSTTMLIGHFRLRVVGIAEVAVLKILEHRNRSENVEQSVDQGEIKKIGTIGKKSDYRQQEHCARADRAGTQQPIKHRRPASRPRQRQRDGNEQRTSRRCKHHHEPSSSVTRRSISLPAKPAAPSRVSE